ncbi:MAG: 5'/3'-nucleotidase SurE, partial [Planctomycetota bacterium]|nr:5'/3'-nucleotidase SurE [Planctomycetota bacterium]
MLESGRILLLTNDDGIDAPGLAVLAGVARNFGTTHTVAPNGPRSGCGHMFNTHASFGFEARGERCHCVDGTPVDCVRLGLHHLAPGAEWVLSGINDGGNLGVDVYASGTVAAVREATLLGRPAIALSQYIAWGRPVDWDRAARMATRV